MADVRVFSTWFVGVSLGVDTAAAQREPSWGPDFPTAPGCPVPKSDQKCPSDRLQGLEIGSDQEEPTETYYDKKKKFNLTQNVKP